VAFTCNKISCPCHSTITPKATASRVGFDKPENTAYSTQQPANQHPPGGIAAVNPLKHILCPQDKRIKKRPYDAKNHPQRQIEPQRIDRRIGEHRFYPRRSSGAGDE
jgi:hypothetical protein